MTETPDRDGEAAEAPDEGERRAGGLLDAARRLGGSALSLANTRLALASLDLTEERDRLLRLAALAIAAATLLALALAAVTAWVVIETWDEHGPLALAGAAVVYAVAGAWCALRLRALAREAPPLLDTTMAELARDAQALRK